MAQNSDIPPAGTIRPVAAPPDSERPTTAMLKADIDSGRTGDKVEAYDPGLAQLGTDDEAAGRPPEPFRVALARRFESLRRWRSGARSGAAHGPGDGFPVLYVAFILAVAIILAGGLAMVWS